MKITKLNQATSNRRAVEIECVPSGNHWEPPSYDVYWRMPDGSVEHIGTAISQEDAEYFADELRKLEALRPL